MKIKRVDTKNVDEAGDKLEVRKKVANKTYMADKDIEQSIKKKS
ncbi:MAG: hypothetical protein P0116_06670 [Candidatus Nitrosocosmicus sp.]|nr:hypothetical protein [Candidatus Nitrosocosmicus sp.]